MKPFICAFFCFLLLSYSNIGSSQKKAVEEPRGGIIISSTSPVNPVVKGLDANPLLCIKIYVPAGKPSPSYQKIHCSLNAEGIKVIDKLEIFFNQAEPLFDAKNSIAKVSPVDKLFSIPVNITAKPGWNYIWFSVTVKETASIDSKIELHANKLVDASGNLQVISENHTSYSKRIGVTLRKAGEDGVNTYRIPGITTTDKGTLIAVYDIRYKNSGDLPGNIDVGMSRSTDGGKSWQPMKVIMDMGAPHENNGIGDPSILFDPITKKIWVAALWSKGNRSIAGSEPGLSPDTTGQFVLVSSEDDGLTWSEPYNITTQVKNPAWHLYFQGPGNGIAMQNGTLVFPSQYWDESKKPGIPHSAIIFSTDHGKTWKSGIGAKSNTTESQVVETTAGTLMLNMRDNRGGYRSIATTTNMGADWTEHFTSYSALPDPVCMGSLIKAKVRVKGVLKEVLFFSNPNSSTARNNITIKASLDLGASWQDINQTLVDERKCYGYSALTRIDDHTIGIVYEGTKDLYFVRIPVSEIIK